jgi:hypothetical protein
MSCPVCNGVGALDRRECPQCCGGRIIGMVGTLDEAEEYLRQWQQVKPSQ